MKANFKIFILLSAFLMIAFTSCKNKEPSVLKVYVRSSDYILRPGASVRLVGDLSKDTPEYFEEIRTNESGAAIFNLDDLFDKYSKGQEKVAYFNVYARDTAEVFTIEKARAKAHLTSTATVVLNQ